MSRPLRVEYAGALYHVTSRGNARAPIYLDDSDFESFLRIFSATCKRYNWLVHSFCLMDNHYHLLIETPDGNLGKGMQHLNSVYTQAFNRKHHRAGHLFQGRYKAILVDREGYLLEVGRYIILNPLRAGMVEKPEDYAWSSWPYLCGDKKAPEWLAVDQTLLLFAKRRKNAIAKYYQFLCDGIGKPLWNNLRNQIFLGSDEFVEKHLAAQDSASIDLSEVPLKQRREKAKTLDEYQQQTTSRNEAIIEASKSGAYTQKQIGEYFGLHYSRVSRIVAKCKI